MANNEVEKEHTGGGGGMNFTKSRSEVKPPFAGRDEEEKLQKTLPERGNVGEQEGVVRTGKVPLHPAFIRLPLRAEGLVLTEMTGYAGWIYDEATLNDLAEMGQQLGVELNPGMQFAVALVCAHAVKTIGYYGWIKAGKPKLHKPGYEEEITEEKEK